MKTGSSGITFAWGIIRLPLILFLVILARRPIATALLNVFGDGRVTLFVINLVSIPASRVLCFVAITAILLATAAVLRRASSAVARSTVFIVGAIVITTVLLASSRSLIFVLPPLLLLATNLIPDQAIRGATPDSRGRSLLMIVAVGLAELFFFWRYIDWLKSRAGSRGASSRCGLVSMLPGIVLAASATAVLFNNYEAVPLEQAIRMSPGTRILVRNTDFNWIQLDRSGRYLFATGHGLNHVLRYDTENWNSTPVVSAVTDGYSQGFIYAPENGELYLFDAQGQRMLYLDATTLRINRSFPLKDVAPGDAWLSYDAKTDAISVSSEADEQTGYAFIVLGRASGKVIDRNNDDAGSLLLNPNKSIEYLNYFRRRSGIEIYDLSRHKVTLKTPFVGHTDRMAVWQEKDALLVTEPMESRIAVLDAYTLSPKGSFSAMFGVRAIAIDEKAGLLLCGSLATGQLEVIRLADGHINAKYYLGPWLRTIELAPDRGVAYVSSNGELFEVKYK
jgi:hypothetical protein